MNIDGNADLTEVVAATHDPPQSAPRSVIENTQLCWKCQALLNSQYPDEVVYKEKDERTLVRTLKTSKFTKTAQEDCPLCQHLLHIMGASMRDSLHRFRRKGLIYEHGLQLNEGNPGCLWMIVTSDNIVDELDGDEIKCFTHLYPISGKFMSKTRTKTYKPFSY